VTTTTLDNQLILLNSSSTQRTTFFSVSNNSADLLNRSVEGREQSQRESQTSTALNQSY
jgi:hypothetical protein